MEEINICPLLSSLVVSETQTKIVVSLIDPIYGKRMNTPVRSVKCLHQYICFDRVSFLTKQLSRCPICSVNCNLGELLVDELILNILHKTGADVHTATILDDETWIPGGELITEDDFMHIQPTSMINSTTSRTRTHSDINNNNLNQPSKKLKTASSSGTFRIKMMHNKKTRYVTVTDLTRQQLIYAAHRRFPGAITSNDPAFDLKLFKHSNENKEELTNDNDVKSLQDGEAVEIISSGSPTTSLLSIPVSAIRWFWWDDDNKWKPYNSDHSTAIENAFRSGNDTVSLHNGLYTITISSRTQRRTNTGKVRKIVRGSWFWVSDYGAPVPYSEATSAQLESAYNEIRQSGDQQSSKNVLVDLNRYCTVKWGTTRQFNLTGSTSGRLVIRGFTAFEESE